MNEKPLVMKMRENYKFFGGMSFLYGIIFTFCLYKNMSGITFPVCVIATIAFSILFLKKINYQLKKYSGLYIAGMMLLSISTVLTSSFFLHFFNLIGIVLLYFTFMIHQFYDDSKWNLPAYIKRIFILSGTTLGSMPYPYWHGSGYFHQNKDQKVNSNFVGILVGILVAFCSLCVILPLLLKSDFIFAGIFGDFFKHIRFGEIFWIVLMIVLGFTLSYAFFCALCKYSFSEEKERKLRHFSPVIGITFTGIISIIYIIYCAIQIIYLFARVQTKLPEGITYAEYARNGFWELLFVSIINFVMVLVCMYIFSDNKILKIILTVISGCTFIMTGSAGYRMVLYIGAYNLTFLRVLVLWFLVVLTFIMAGIIITIYKENFRLFHYIMLIVSVFYIAFSFSRPDTMIAKYNIAHFDQMSSDEIYSNINYLIYSSSLDAAPELAKIDIKHLPLTEDNMVEIDLEGYFEYISEENSEIDLRKINYSKIMAKHTADKWKEEHTEYSEY